MSTTGAFLDASGLEYFYDGIKLQFADIQYELKVDTLTEMVGNKADSATTLAGYGITDAGISNGVITIGSNTITPLTSSDVTSTYSSSGTAPVNGTAVASAISGKATISDIYGVGKNIYAAAGNTKDLNSDTYKAVGRYYAGTSVTSYISNKPLSTTTAGFQLTVEYNGATNRYIQTITYNTTEAGILGTIYKRWYTSSGWSTWFKYEGTAVT